jgi:uncharacterized protein
MSTAAVVERPVQIEPSIVTPILKKDRIVFLDCVRGVALLGILIMNSMAQSQSHFFYDAMNLNQPLTGPNFYVWLAERGLFEGTMRGLFSILFGAGSFILLSRLQKQKSGLEPADIYYRRMLWLLVFGLINAFVFLWPGDILYPYALCGLVLFPFRNWSVKKLLLSALFLLALGTYRESSKLNDDREVMTKGQIAEVLVAKKQKLTDDQQDDLKKWQVLKEKGTSAGMMKAADEETKKVKGKSYGAIFKYFRDLNMRIESIGFYNGWWDMLMFFFIGIALYKSKYLTAGLSNGLYITVAIVGISAGLLMNYYLLKSEYHNKFDYLLFLKEWKFTFYQLRRVLQTLGYLSLLILLYKVIPFRKVLNIFAPVGQMAFTNYLSQSIITSIVFYGLGLYATLQRYEVYYVVGAIWIFQIIFSHVWLRYFAFGPFEWVWRSLTYLHRQPFLKKRSISHRVPEFALN